MAYNITIDACRSPDPSVQLQVVFATEFCSKQKLENQLKIKYIHISLLSNLCEQYIGCWFNLSCQQTNYLIRNASYILYDTNRPNVIFSR